jgi:hypothetical protein
MCQWAPLCARCCPLGACLPRLKGAPHGVSPAQGIEVGLVAKLTAHASAVTLGHYTQAVRGGDDAVEALDRAYRKAGYGGIVRIDVSAVGAETVAGTPARPMPMQTREPARSTAPMRT